MQPVFRNMVKEGYESKENYQHFLNKKMFRFLLWHPDFLSLFRGYPKLKQVLAFDRYPFAYKSGVYIPSTESVIVTSDRYTDASGSPRITVSRLTKDPDKGSWKREELPTTIPMPCGGTNFRNGILLCAQGTLTQPASLSYMELSPPHRSTTLLNHFHGRDFNSPQDVAVHSDGSIWFTDPICGFEQGFRPKPRLPSQVYRFDASGDEVRVVADGFGRPGGICFAPDEKTLYVGDTDRVHGDGATDDTRASTIYAFDVILKAESPFLINRRVFAMADAGVPNGIGCDVHGNVYAGCGDGLNVWSPGGVLIGKVLVEGGISGFCFAEKGELVLLNGHGVWTLQMHESTKGALLSL